MKDRLEALLFAAGRFVDEDQMAKLLVEDVRNVKKSLQELKADFEARGDATSLQVVQEDKSWKLHVKDKYLDLVSKLVSEKEIATTVLETLAIIAWRNPAMQAELIKIRGPAAYEHVQELIERGFVTKVPEGRTFKLKVTDKFFEYFDVENREQLKGLFKQVEDQAASQQAEIDKQQAVYESQKKAAAAAAQAIADGKDPAALQPPNLENSQPASSEHSAQTSNQDLITESKQEADKLAETGALTAEIRQEVDALKEDINQLRMDNAQLKEIPEAIKKPRKKKGVATEVVHHHKSEK